MIYQIGYQKMFYYFSFEDGKDFSWKGCSSDKRYFGPFDEPALDKDM